VVPALIVLERTILKRNEGRGWMAAAVRLGIAALPLGPMQEGAKCGSCTIRS